MPETSMSCNTRWSSRNRSAARTTVTAALAAMALALAGDPAPAASGPAELLSAVPAAAPRAVPDGVTRLLPEAVAVGAGTLRFWGLTIYHAYLYAPPDWRPDALGQAPVVLELHYQRAFKGADIARRSIEEMRRAGPMTRDEESAWLSAMERVFPDVRAGDRIAGLWQPGIGARFVLTRANGSVQSLGSIEGGRFAERFFGIWLAPTTSEPTLRQALLGGGSGVSRP
jgi:hypothetical protein